MKLRKLRHNGNGSIYPIAIFVIVLCMASVLLLVFNYVIEPFMNIMDSDYDTSSDVSAPRHTVAKLVNISWTKGLLIVIMLGSGFGLLMEYQKRKYQMG